MSDAKDCFACKGEGELSVTGMFSKDKIKCWYCQGSGKEYDAKQRAIEVQTEDAKVTAAQAERTRIKTQADKLAFAIQHSCDGKCV